MNMDKLNLNVQFNCPRFYKPAKMPTQKTLLSIKEAAETLKVSEKTLRRWEAKGILSPIRTAGGHRRYQLNDLKVTKTKKRQNVNFLPKPETILIDYKSGSFGNSAENISFSKTDSTEQKVGVNILPNNSYKSLPKTYKFITFALLSTFILFITLFLSLKNNLSIKSEFAGDLRKKLGGLTFVKEGEDKSGIE